MKFNHWPRIGALLVVSSSALVGCGSSLTPAGRAVQFSDAVSTARCQPLGDVTAVDSSLRSRWAAGNDPRSEAAARTATHIVLIPYAFQPIGYSTQRARAFRCSR